ncbi:MAG: preprotein translocase subunit SecF [Candidatus Peregrinibacteria bacterium Greene0416_19]|nr:MAG: preprotein translocase subunit SecF [Candidatus Peregrinibacteria bacterium Greene0416_19]
MSFLKMSRLFLTISATLVLASVALLVLWGPRFSIEFTGGTLMEVRLPEGKSKIDLTASLQTFDPTREKLGNASVSALHGGGDTSYLLRMKLLTNEEHLALLDHLQSAFGPVTELQFTTIGPSVSQSLRQKSFIAIAVVSVAVVAYLAFSFRKLPRKLSPWKFGTLAVVGFIHDVLITCGIFVIVSHYTTFEFDTLFVTALLTILAYSVNDTIVIFDRVRANIISEDRHKTFADVVVKGLRECVTRTMHTTISGLIMLFALFFLGSDSIRWFILALIVGTIIGTYSSYFIAAPLLVLWRDPKER